MLKISLDASKSHAAVDGMLKKLSHFRRVDIGQEMSEWQTEDMNRNSRLPCARAPRVERQPIIRPHSLFEVQQRARPVKKYERAIRRLLRGKKAQAARNCRIQTPRRGHICARCFTSNCKRRMQRLLKEKLQWR